jgi:nucleoside-diphosphate-sugar epimerase
VVATFQDAITTPEQVDELLAKLADRVLAGAVPADREISEADDLAGAVVFLLTRHLLAEARADVVRRLVERSGTIESR